jgi:hypothetical protein
MASEFAHLTQADQHIAGVKERGDSRYFLDEIKRISDEIARRAARCPLARWVHCFFGQPLTAPAEFRGQLPAACMFWTTTRGLWSSPRATPCASAGCP